VNLSTILHRRPDSSGVIIGNHLPFTHAHHRLAAMDLGECASLVSAHLRGDVLGSKPLQSAEVPAVAEEQRRSNPFHWHNMLFLTEIKGQTGMEPQRNCELTAQSRKRNY
jgi:hypothetical protein